MVVWLLLALCLSSLFSSPLLLLGMTVKFVGVVNGLLTIEIALSTYLKILGSMTKMTVSKNQKIKIFHLLIE
jgi:RsiW-degrading membrane proteinase PrsW (M82 family)